MVNDITFQVSPLNNLASANIWNPIFIASGSQNKGTRFTATGSFGTVVGVSAIVNSDTTFVGWSYTSGSKTNIFNSGSTIQVTLNGSGSTLYALVENNVVSASFCYYASDPTGTADCEACATTKTLYYDGSLLSGSSYTSLTWFKDSNTATTADAGYYKLVNTEVNTPIYQVSAGPVQTKTLIGYCSDAILTC